jgi:hypothetical protein
MQPVQVSPPARLFWAVVRTVLGILQMTGSIISVTLLFRLGLVRETLIAVGATGVITLLSIILFKWLKVQEKHVR